MFTTVKNFLHGHPVRAFITGSVAAVVVLFLVLVGVAASNPSVSSPSATVSLPNLTVAPTTTPAPPVVTMTPANPTPSQDAAKAQTQAEYQASVNGHAAYKACQAYAASINDFPYGIDWPIFAYSQAQATDGSWTITTTASVKNAYGTKSDRNISCTTSVSFVVTAFAVLN